MSFKNLNLRSTPYQVNHVIVILLLSGDVQLNQGSPTRTPKYSCGGAAKIVTLAKRQWNVRIVLRGTKCTTSVRCIKKGKFLQHALKKENFCNMH